MVSKINEKQLCWNCDGYVSNLLSSCPYCGVFLKDPSMIDDEVETSIFGADSSKTAEEEGFLFPKSGVAFQSFGNEKDFLNQQKKLKEEIEKQETVKSHFSKQMVPLFFLFCGAGLLVFSILMLLFASGCELILRWNLRSLWFYLPGSALLLYLGHKFYGEDDDSSSENSL